MSEATETTTNAAAAPATTEMSFEQRADAIFGTDAEAAAALTDPSAAPATAEGAALAPPADDEVTKARAARRDALKAAQAKERERVDAMAAVRERDDLRKKLAEEQERSKAYTNLVDPSKLTKEQFFALAEQNPELTPKELGEWLRERMANPEAAAARAAKTAVDPELAKLREELAAEREENRKFRESHKSAAVEAEERQAAQQLSAYAREAASTSPLTARFSSVATPEEFYEAARLAAERLPEGSGAQAILDEMEEALIHQRDAWKALYADDTSIPQRQQALTPSSPAAAKAPTNVSNALAQQRTAVVNESADFARLPLHERAARVFGT